MKLKDLIAKLQQVSGKVPEDTEVFIFVDDSDEGQYARYPSDITVETIKHDGKRKWTGAPWKSAKIETSLNDGSQIVIID